MYSHNSLLVLPSGALKEGKVGVARGVSRQHQHLPDWTCVKHHNKQLKLIRLISKFCLRPDPHYKSHALEAKMTKLPSTRNP